MSYFDDAELYKLELPELNVSLFNDIIKWAVGDSQGPNSDFKDWGNWDQNFWGREDRNGVCQTAFCIAGQAAAQVGYKMNLKPYADLGNGITRFVAHDATPQYFAGLDEAGKRTYKDVPGAPVRGVSDIAREALGLADFEAGALFSGNNTIEKVVWLADCIAKSRGVTLDHAHVDISDYQRLDVTDFFDIITNHGEYNDAGRYRYVTNYKADYLYLMSHDGKYPEIPEIVTCETCGQVVPEDKVTEPVKFYEEDFSF